MYPDHQQWVRSDQIVQAWLVGSLSEDILGIVLGAHAALEVWISLGNHFNRVSSSRLFELQRRLQTVTKANKTMSDYLKEIKDLCDQLHSVGSPVTEKMKVFATLQGLGREYEPIKTSIEGAMDSPTAPSFEDTVPRLTWFEDRLKSYEVSQIMWQQMINLLHKIHTIHSRCLTSISTVVEGATVEDLVMAEA